MGGGGADMEIYQLHKLFPMGGGGGGGGGANKGGG